MNAPPDTAVLTEALVWELLLAFSKRTRASGAPRGPVALCLDAEKALAEVPIERGWVLIEPSGASRPLWPMSPAASELLELCLPLCLGAADGHFVFGHIGQSLDGQIATASGASRYVTGSANIRHMHRLRALADGVLVGSATVECDDPRLTTRLVPGESPARIVIDPSLRLPLERHVFQDGAARTLIVCRAGAVRPARWPANIELVEVSAEGTELAPLAILEQLFARGLRRVFIEGGGITVSRFLGAGALDRLHVTVCPMFIGQGRPGIVLPAVDRLEQALRPRARRFLLDEDVLFDCELSRAVG